jgi:hypothetical protein
MGLTMTPTSQEEYLPGFPLNNIYQYFRQYNHEYDE